jgi:citrate lyase subunit beta/citryl-CoA lyase
MAPATTPLPIRSALLVPGHDEERLAAAAESAADALYVDLEAAVPGHRLEEARSLVRDRLATLAGAGKLVVVRVNPVSSGDTEADLEAVVREGLYGVALAKIDRVREVRELDGMLATAERRAALAVGSIVIHPVIENANAVRKAYRIARASDRVAHMGGVVAPGGDLARSIGFAGSLHGAETHYVRGKVLVDARAAGVRFPLSGIPADRDEEVLRAAAVDARAMGYEGLLLGYRSHAPIVNEVFTPTEAEVARWRELAFADGSQRREPDAATQAWALERLAVAERFGVARAAFGAVGPRMRVRVRERATLESCVAARCSWCRRGWSRSSSSDWR